MQNGRSIARAKEEDSEQKTATATHISNFYVFTVCQSQEFAFL